LKKKRNENVTEENFIQIPEKGNISYQKIPEDTQLSPFSLSSYYLNINILTTHNQLI